MTAEGKRWIAAVVALGCCVCQTDEDVVPHHVTSWYAIDPEIDREPDKRRSDYRVLALCARHHNMGNRGEAIEVSAQAWEENHGTQRDWLRWTYEALTEHDPQSWQ